MGRQAGGIWIVDLDEGTAQKVYVKLFFNTKYILL